MIEGIVQVALAGLSEGSGATKGGKELDPGLDADSAENIVTVVVPLVESRGGGAGRLGDTAHGESFFAAPGPQPAGGVEDALFELRVWLSGQRPASVSPSIIQGRKYFDYV
jgi:hypothetical protein